MKNIIASSQKQSLLLSPVAFISLLGWQLLRLYHFRHPDLYRNAPFISMPDKPEKILIELYRSTFLLPSREFQLQVIHSLVQHSRNDGFIQRQ